MYLVKANLDLLLEPCVSKHEFCSLESQVYWIETQTMDSSRYLALVFQFYFWSFQKTEAVVKGKALQGLFILMLYLGQPYIHAFAVFIHIKDRFIFRKTKNCIIVYRMLVIYKRIQCCNVRIMSSF